MKINNFLISLIISSLIYSCQTKTASKNLNSDSISKSSLIINDCLIAHESEIFKNYYFPFVFENYNTEKLKAFFDKSITVDSVETNNSGYITRIYKFSNKVSEISFFVKINDTETFYYLQGATIKDNLFETKNGFEINMTRKDFFKAINTDIVNCDTFTIQEGDMATYYRFIFEKDRLKVVEIQTTE